MAVTITAREANHRFSEILGLAAEGETVVITRHGKPVAELVQHDASRGNADRAAAWERLIAMMAKGYDLGGEKFDRESLYDR